MVGLTMAVNLPNYLKRHLVRNAIRMNCASRMDLYGVTDDLILTVRYSILKSLSYDTDGLLFSLLRARIQMCPRLWGYMP